MKKRFLLKTTHNLLILTALFFLLTGFYLICDTGSYRAAAQQRKPAGPIRKAAFLKAVSTERKLKYGITEFVRLIESKGVAFRVTPQIESEFRAAKVHPNIIQAARDNYRGVTNNDSGGGRRSGETYATTTDNRIMTNTVVFSNLSNFNRPIEANPVRGNSNISTAAAADDDNETDEDKTDREYDTFYDQAVNAAFQLVSPGINQQQAQTIIEKAKSLALSAIKIDPDRPDAYKIYGFIAFLTQNYAAAERHAQQVIDRNGSIQFDILHFHGQTPAPEVLYISNESVSIEAANGEFNVFKYSQIRSVQYKGMMNFGPRTAAVFSMNVLQNGNVYETFFIPSFRGTPDDAQLIVRIIEKNLQNGK